MTRDTFQTAGEGGRPANFHKILRQPIHSDKTTHTVLYVWKCTPAIITYLRQSGELLHFSKSFDLVSSTAQQW